MTFSGLEQAQRTLAVVSWAEGRTSGPVISDVARAAVQTTWTREELAVRLRNLAQETQGTPAGGLLFRTPEHVEETDWFAVASILRNAPRGTSRDRGQTSSEPPAVPLVKSAARPRRLRLVTQPDPEPDPLAGDPDAPF